MSKERKLKVYRKCRERLCDGIYVPEIKFEGVWLEMLGFTIGSGIVISQEPNKLIITVDECRRAPAPPPEEPLVVEKYAMLYR